MGILCDLIAQKEFIKAGFLFISVLGILFLILHIGLEITNRIILFRFKKSLKDFLNKCS